MKSWNAGLQICVYADMHLRSIRLAAFAPLTILLLPLLPGQPQATQPGAQATAGRTAPAGGVIPMPPDREKDSYAIYSMLMPGEEFARMSPEQTGQWAIAAVTVNLDDRNPAVPPQGQLKPPPNNPRGFTEAVGDYESNKYVRVRLKKEPFTISHAFSLLSADQVSALRATKTSPTASSEAQTQWGAYPGVTFFSEVYFDSKHQAALVYMNDWCAQLCAAGSWVYLEKQGGHWVRRSGVTAPGA